ncbi:tautomerase family protein [Nocardia gipuzkoensis]
MPFARLTLADPEVSADVRARFAAEVTALLEKDLLKEPEVTVVQVNPVAAANWFVAGAHPERATGVHLEVSITSGTNTAQEKSAFIAHAYELLGELFGPLPAAAYVALYELDGESYGYNGVTQLARRRLDPAEKD